MKLRAVDKWFAALAASVVVAFGSIVAAPPAFADSATVDYVIDGDTLTLTDGTRVRLLGMDTPEKGECGFSKAKDKLAALTKGKSVSLTGSSTDKYGRRLAYVDVNGVDAGAELIKAGLARPRYNSTDGYGANSRDSDYFTLAATVSHICGLDMNQYTTTTGATTGNETRYVSTNTLNIRSGPGTDYPVQGKFSRGAKVEVSETQNGFRKLSTGGWISAQYLSATAVAPNPVKAAPKTTAPKASNPAPSSSSNGDSCYVKGNINKKGEHIYHVRGGRWYDKTNPEACFSSVEEARAAGYRASKNG